MLRYLAGAASALLLVAAGFVIWTSRAGADDPVPPAPSAQPLFAPLSQPPSAPPAADKTAEQKRFGRYDDNEDGAITRAEMMASRRSAWDKLDTDKNGRLDFEEWAVTTSEKFAEADKDRSGALNAAEFLTTKRVTKPKKCAC